MGGGGGMSLDHFKLRFTGMSSGVDGASWVNIACICRVLAILYICWVIAFEPMGVSLWCMHRVCMAQLSILGSICIFDGIVGSTYVMVAALHLEVGPIAM